MESLKLQLNIKFSGNVSDDNAKSIESSVENVITSNIGSFQPFDKDRHIEDYSVIKVDDDNNLPVFHNGFHSWMETYYEITLGIANELFTSEPQGLVGEKQNSGGSGAVRDLAYTLTNKFELLNKGRQWDGEFYDEIVEFINEELYPKNN